MTKNLKKNIQKILSMVMYIEKKNLSTPTVNAPNTKTDIFLRFKLKTKLDFNQ